MRCLVLCAAFVLLAALPVRSSLTDAQLQQIRQQAVQEATQLLGGGGGGGRSSSAGASSDAAIERAASRLEMHLLKAASIEHWGAQAQAQGSRRLLADVHEEAHSLPALSSDPVEFVPGRRRLLAAGVRPSPEAAAPHCTLLADTELPLNGSSISNSFINTTDPGECCAACDFRLDCFAWTVKVNTPDSLDGCYLRGKSFGAAAPAPGYTSGTMTPDAAWSAPVPVLAPLATGAAKFAEVMKLSWSFFAAQRSGALPADDPLAPWRASAHLSDAVPGGWYDAGDYLKLNFPLGTSLSFLAWAMVDFNAAFTASGQMADAQAALRVPLDYMLACYDEAGQRYTGQIGLGQIDNDYWGRPQDEDLPRPGFVWDASTPGASDLLSSAAAAFASSSLVFRSSDPAYADLLLSKAKSIYAWAISKEGRYTNAYPNATKTLYPSTDFLDDQAWAAAWLFRATKTAKYLTQAASFWARSYGKNPAKADIYPGWDSVWAPTAVVMRNLRRGGAKVPGMALYNDYWNKAFWPSWYLANGKNDIVKTPKGLLYPSWNRWANLQFATTVAMVTAHDARLNPSKKLRGAEVHLVHTQLDYALGSTGRSFVVGWGSSPPVNPHHAAATCPLPPAPCDWQNFHQKDPNANVLVGALVGGPGGVGRNKTNPDFYADVRMDYALNEPAIDYQAGFVGALAGMYTLLGGPSGAP